MLKWLLILGGLGVAAVGSIMWVAAIGTSTASYELKLTLRDRAGQPLRLQPVVVWRYDYPSQEYRTDSAGRVTIPGYQQFTANMITGPRRPDAFLIRLTFPQQSPLFYRFELRQDGPVPYQVFNTQYDYLWGHQWVGDFEEKGRVRSRTEPDNNGKVYTTVSPSGGQTLLWQATTALQRVNQEKKDSRFVIELNLQEKGFEKVRNQ